MATWAAAWMAAWAALMIVLGASVARAQEPPTPAAPAAVPAIKLVELIDGLDRPLQVTHAGDGSGRLFVVEQEGRVRIWNAGALRAVPFLDITSITNTTCGECGLLGIAFPPDFAQSGVFYVSYTARGNPVAPEDPNEPDPADGNDSVIARYRVSTGDPNRADPASRQPILLLNQPYRNHNGGQITFGPDGKFYVTFGDGGDRGDPLNAAQRRDTLLGKVLRLTVGNSGAYSVPADNPFVGRAGIRPELWLWGLRNPWRWSFDRATGDLWLADVGQGLWEEVNFVAAAKLGGQNFGWRIREGSGCYLTASCAEAGLTPPIFEYSHTSGAPQGDSVTGGYVYRGPETLLNGIYFFGDLSGWIGALQRTADGVRFQQMLAPGFSLASFGEDETGNLYVADLSGGRIFRIQLRDAWPYRLALPLITHPE